MDNCRNISCVYYDEVCGRHCINPNIEKRLEGCALFLIANIDHVAGPFSEGLEGLDRLKEELRITDLLLSERQRVLDAIPACKLHGSCVPHALEWIEKAKIKMAD